MDFIKLDGTTVTRTSMAPVTATETEIRVGGNHSASDSGVPGEGVEREGSSGVHYYPKPPSATFLNLRPVCGTL